MLKYITNIFTGRFDAVGTSSFPSFAELTGQPSDNSALAIALGNKVDKITGKGLSTNDFTDAYKTKVDANVAYRIVFFTTLQSSPIWHTNAETLTAILDAAISGVEYSTNNGSTWTTYSIPISVSANSESLWRVTSFNPTYLQGCLTLTIS